MPVPPDKAIKFFVYIIESPSEVDLYHDRSEGALIKRVLSLRGIPCVTRVAISSTAFDAALRIGLVEEMQAMPRLLPIIHLSAHGSQEGIQLSNGEIITWTNLRNLLLPINRALHNWLLLCMSSCKGFAACKMAMLVSASEHPFCSMVGNLGTPEWADTAVAYTAFYHLFAKDYRIDEAVLAMRGASGDNGWDFTTAAQAQADFLEQLYRINAERARQQLQELLSKQPVSASAKKLEPGKK